MGPGPNRPGSSWPAGFGSGRRGSPLGQSPQTDSKVGAELSRLTQALEQATQALEATQAELDQSQAGLASAQAELEAATAESAENLERLQRETAAHQNSKRRHESELQTQISKGVGAVVESLLPILDACDAAIHTAGTDNSTQADQSQADQSQTGISQIAQLLLATLEKAGLERINPVGTPFDPHEHEAIATPTTPTSTEPTSTSTDAELIVTEEFRAGYRFDGQVLRASMVKVGHAATRS